MNGGNEDSEAVLYAAYLDEVEQYAVALRLASELSAVCRGDEAIENRLNQVLDLLAAIGQKDALLTPVKKQWEQAGRPNNDALRIVMDRIAALIPQIQRELQTAEQAVRARCDRLAGDLDACNRGYRMQRAYQRKS